MILTYIYNNDNNIFVDNQQYCPTRAYPGLWELVINQLSVNENIRCATTESCPKNMTGEEVYRMLVHNFKRHYFTNRAPLGLHFHSAWFKNSEYFKAFEVD